MPVARNDIEPQTVENGEITLQPDLDHADLRDDRVGVMGAAPKARRSTPGGQEFTIENKRMVQTVPLAVKSKVTVRLPGRQPLPEIRMPG